ncbi:hypothetical protein PFICI_09723 [Pestalotiopsis fici W106-1]|uniref:Rhodopsin domain-containing protein n=1 Tax=Pestalotiopsis fici (strain W106-1 / CGMCC3.15140) TaxID=1229662 RepID=W3WXP7_PESFW|nr:uncharacterized protein PFICI_09723 [Pestalotiopsis fici W106-1]ETS77661.1 hypothetical protein PFICI_09723 [Pestalotiopsis fici W106-1]
MGGDFALFLLLAVIALRFYARFTAKPNNWFGALGLDDALVGLSWVVLLLTQIFIQVAAGYGNGKHYDALSRYDQVEAMKWNTMIDAVIIWAFSLPKLAIVALLRRILNYGLHTSVLLWGLTFVGQALIFSMSVFLFIQCSPTEKNWDKSIEGICLPDSTMIGIEYFVSSYSAFLDLFLAIFPAPFIMRLNMPLRTRLAVSGALGLGVFASIIQGYKLSIMGASFKYTDEDPTYPLPFLNTFGITEACLLLIAGSLPALGPLIRRAKDHVERITSSGGWSVTEIGGYLSSRSKRSQLEKDSTAATHDERPLTRKGSTFHHTTNNNSPTPLTFHGYDIHAPTTRPHGRKASEGSTDDQRTLTLDDDIESRAGLDHDGGGSRSPSTGSGSGSATNMTRLSPPPMPLAPLHTASHHGDAEGQAPFSEKYDDMRAPGRANAVSDKLKGAWQGLRQDGGNVVLACVWKHG